MSELLGGFGILQSHDAKFFKKLHGEFLEANVTAGFRRGVYANLFHFHPSTKPERT
jgi:hypothetical protein